MRGLKCTSHSLVKSSSSFSLCWQFKLTILINSRTVAIYYPTKHVKQLAQINTNGLVAFHIFHVKGHKNDVNGHFVTKNSV